MEVAVEVVDERKKFDAHALRHRHVQRSTCRVEGPVGARDLRVDTEQPRLHVADFDTGKETSSGELTGRHDVRLVGERH